MNEIVDETGKSNIGGTAGRPIYEITDQHAADIEWVIVLWIWTHNKQNVTIK